MKARTPAVATTPALIILFIVSFNLASRVFAETAELTVGLIDARLSTLRASGAEERDETVKAYETALDWLNQAASHNRQASYYLDALTDAPKREAEIQARMDTFKSARYPTADTQNLSRQELEAQLTLTRTEISDATNALNDLEQRLATRETTATRIRTRLNDIDKRLGEVAELEISIDPDAPPSMAEASKWITMAERIALVAERQAQEARLTSQPVRYSALRAEGAELALRIETLTEKERALETLVRSKLLAVADPEALGIGVDHPLYTIVDRLTSDNTRLRQERLYVERRLDTVSATQDDVEKVTRTVGERFATAQRVVEFASGSELLGKVLLANWREIENFRRVQSTEQVSQQVGDTVISRISHEKGLAELISASNYVAEQVETAGLALHKISNPDRDILLELARSKRELLRRIIAVESDYVDALSQLEAGYARLKDLIDEYETYLSALVVWIPSRQLLWKSNFAAIPTELGYVLNALEEFRVAIRPWFFVTFLIASVLVYARSRLRALQHAQNMHLIRARDDSIRFTLFALLLTALRASPVPLLIFAVSMLFSQDHSPEAVALMNTVTGLVIVLFALTFMRTLSEESGVARTHFDWQPQTCDRLHTEASWLIRWWLPVATLASFLFMLDDDTVLVGRLTLLFAIFLLIGHLGNHIRRDMQINGRRCLSTYQNRLRLALMVVLAVVVAGIIWGLRYSVSVVTSRLMVTLWIGLSLLILYNFLMRWLYVARRRLRLAERLAAQTEPLTGETVPDGEDQADLGTIGVETQQLLSAVILTTALIALLYVWAPLLPAFDALARVPLWAVTTVMEGESVSTQITLGTLIMVIFLIGVTFYSVRKLPALVELVLRSRTRMTPSVRYTTSTLLGYVIVGTGIVAALSTLGLRWSQLQWLIAALGVGIGFGLQEIIANFISGLIILFERPIRVGDVVTVGDKDGTVMKIRIRATTILDYDGRELLVPNKEFITGRLLNWTLSSPHVRAIVSVRIAYGSDVERALRILQEVADDHPRILDDPAPSIIFQGFGDNALELTARFFVDSLDARWPITTEVHREIYKRFAEADIAIAFPQRDVHLDSAQPIRIAIDPAANK